MLGGAALHAFQDPSWQRWVRGRLVTLILHPSDASPRFWPAAGCKEAEAKWGAF